MARILIVDDHVMVRAGIHGLLARQPDFVVVGEASSYGDAVERLRTHATDVAIIDITMPGRDGFELVGYLNTVYPQIRIVVLSMHAADEYVSRALKAGAHGYVTKDCPPDQLIAAVRRVTAGAAFLSPRVAEALAVRLMRPDSDEPPHTRLSSREFSIFGMLVQGKTVTSIARELAISVKTVSTHKMHVLRKMNLRNQSELIRYAIENRVSAS